VPETTERQNRYLKSTRVSLSKGLLTIGAATILLFAVSALLEPASVSVTSLSGMLPVAAVLAIAGLGQMLVVQQGGIDLSVAGGISLAIVIVTHIPDGDNGRLIPAILLAIALAVVAGVLNGVLIGGLGLNPIIATLGTNAVLYGVNLSISGGRPRITTTLLGNVAGGSTAGIPNSIFFAVATLAVVAAVVKRTVSGRRFEAIGANFRAARAAGCGPGPINPCATYGHNCSTAWQASLIAGITSQPTAYAGDTYLLPSIAVVVLGGTSLLGGRGFPLPTVVAAIFLEQLIQLVSVLGVSPAISPLVQAAALAIGISLYTVNWQAVLAPLTRASQPAAAAG
jgi:ribose transport system permease protein